MSIGTPGSNDMGVSLEVRFQEAGKIGRDVLVTARNRSELRVNGKTPSILFLEPNRFSEEYKSGLEKSGSVDPTAVRRALKASFGLSLESALQIIAAKPTKNEMVENTDSLEEISRVLNTCGKFISAEGAKNPELLTEVAKEVIKRSGVEQINGDLIVWSDEIMGKAEKRIVEKIDMLKQYLGQGPF